MWQDDNPAHLVGASVALTSYSPPAKSPAENSQFCSTPPEHILQIPLHDGKGQNCKVKVGKTIAIYSRAGLERSAERGRKAYTTQPRGPGLDVSSKSTASRARPHFA
jgi:hypothetical protein